MFRTPCIFKIVNFWEICKYLEKPNFLILAKNIVIYYRSSPIRIKNNLDGYGVITALLFGW